MALARPTFRSVLYDSPHFLQIQQDMELVFNTRGYLAFPAVFVHARDLAYRTLFFLPSMTSAALWWRFSVPYDLPSHSRVLLYPLKKRWAWFGGNATRYLLGE